MTDSSATSSFEEDGTEAWKASWAYKLFVLGECDADENGQPNQFERPLIISDRHDLVQKYLGQRPVIFVDFREVGSNSHNMEDLIEETAYAISNCFYQHEYLEDVLQKRIDDADMSRRQVNKAKEWLTQFQRVLRLSTIVNQRGTKWTEFRRILAQGLRVLSDILHEVYQKKVRTLTELF
jgi:hypothetical protein